LSVASEIHEGQHPIADQAFRRRTEMRLQYRAYLARLAGRYVDIRGLAADRPDLYTPDDDAAAQAFGEGVRTEGGAGIVYDSVRHRGGTNTVAFRPRNVLDVTMGAHFEITAPSAGKVVARTL
jgi:hypothetical protein